jgi:phosphoribosylanthranilate isomerase
MNNKNIFRKHQDGSPKVKICGLTDYEEALQCAQLGADAIGFVFYPGSSRYVDPEKAGEIVANLPKGITPVAVFVDESLDNILDTLITSGIRTIQLHGNESPDMVAALYAQGLTIIKTLFANRPPWVFEYFRYEAHAFLVESPSGDMPGGGGNEWDWSKIREYSGSFPLVLAGGLTPENVFGAIQSASPVMVDVSSGVESSPGRKDLNRVRSFIEQSKRISQMNYRSMIL